MNTQTVYRAYKTELKPTQEQKILFLKAAGVARFAWNWGLKRRIEEYQNTGKSSGYIEQSRQLNAIKAIEFPWMYEVSSHISQESLRDLEKAYQNFFRRVKNKEKAGFPKFKSRKKGIGHFRLKQNIHVSEKHIQLPRIGKVRLKQANYLPNDAKILSATVSEKAGRWFVSVQVEEIIPILCPTGEPVGIDLGIKTMAVVSDGQVFQNPRALYRYERKLAKLQKKLARQKLTSNRRKKTKTDITKVYYHVANIRKDAINKATSSIVARNKPENKRPSVIVIENLNVSGMVKNRKLSKAVSNVGMYEFKRQLEYKVKWYGGNIILADRFFPSSKTCSSCGYIKPLLKLSERVFKCENCGVEIDRDYNAALNLKKLAVGSPDSINGRGVSVRLV